MIDPEVQKKFEAATTELVRKFQLQVDELTERQLGEAIRQIILSGDLTKYVQVGSGKQCVVYIPFAREQKLEGRITRLEELLKKHGIPIEEQFE